MAHMVQVDQSSAGPIIVRCRISSRRYWTLQENLWSLQEWKCITVYCRNENALQYSTGIMAAAGLKCKALSLRIQRIQREPNFLLKKWLVMKWQILQSFIHSIKYKLRYLQNFSIIYKKRLPLDIYKTSLLYTKKGYL